MTTILADSFTASLADSFTASLAKLANDEQKQAKLTAFDLQTNPRDSLVVSGIQPRSEFIDDLRCR